MRPPASDQRRHHRGRLLALHPPLAARLPALLQLLADVVVLGPVSPAQKEAFSKACFGTVTASFVSVENERGGQS